MKKVTILESRHSITADKITNQLIWYALFDNAIAHNISRDELEDKLLELDNNTLELVFSESGLDKSMWDKDSGTIVINNSDVDKTLELIKKYLPEYLKLSEYDDNKYALSINHKFYSDNKSNIIQSLQNDSVNESVGLDDIKNLASAKAVLNGFVESDADTDAIVRKYRELQQKYIAEVVTKANLNDYLLQVDAYGQPVIMLDEDEYAVFADKLDSGFSLTEYKTYVPNRKPYIISIDHNNATVKSQIEEFIQQTQK